MADRFIPMSEDEQKFGDLVERVFTNRTFARDMERDPVRALTSAGYKLSAAQKKTLRRATPRAESLDAALKLPKFKPVVKIITKGTKPAVRVVTKGTKPAVSVAVNSVVAVKESKASPLEFVDE